MSMIYPFTIEKTVEYSDGTLVTFTAAKKDIQVGFNMYKGISAPIFVPTGNDINEFVYEYLNKEGWIV